MVRTAPEASPFSLVTTFKQQNCLDWYGRDTEFSLFFNAQMPRRIILTIPCLPDWRLFTALATVGLFSCLICSFRKYSFESYSLKGTFYICTTGYSFFVMLYNLRMKSSCISCSHISFYFNQKTFLSLQVTVGSFRCLNLTTCEKYSSVYKNYLNYLLLDQHRALFIIYYSHYFLFACHLSYSKSIRKILL